MAGSGFRGNASHAKSITPNYQNLSMKCCMKSYPLSHKPRACTASTLSTLLYSVTLNTPPRSVSHSPHELYPAYPSPKCVTKRESHFCVSLWCGEHVYRPGSKTINHAITPCREVRRMQPSQELTHLLVRSCGRHTSRVWAGC